MAQSSSDPNLINQVPIGIGADSVALLFGGSPRLLLVRESLITAVFGLAFLFSLLLPRPMMFYFARNFIAGTDPARQSHVRLFAFNVDYCYNPRRGIRC